jgi:RHS repeat-associated protein
MVASQAQGSATRSWTLDPAVRLRAAVASGTTTRTNHYDDASSDSPSWIDEDTGAATLSATRYVPGLDGNLAAVVTHTGGSTSARWQLVNLHGDVVGSCADDPALTTPDGPTLDADEFGNVRGTGTARYGWLGGKQRSTDALAGLVLMGVRLYNPVLGRFLQVDPVPGGSCNDYDYTCADPVNGYDLDGRCCGWLKKARHWAWEHKWDIALTAASFVPVAAPLAWGYRAYRVVRVARAAYQAGRVGRSIRATRATSWLAGRMWVGRGAYRGTARNGTRWLRSHRHAFSWRAAARKGRHGWSSNLDHSIPGRHNYWTFHINHRSPSRWARWL